MREIAADDFAVAATHAVDDLEIAKLESRGGGFDRRVTLDHLLHSVGHQIDRDDERGNRERREHVAHHARQMSAYCSAIWSPQSGDGGCGP